MPWAPAGPDAVHPAARDLVLDGPVPPVRPSRRETGGAPSGPASEGDMGVSTAPRAFAADRAAPTSSGSEPGSTIPLAEARAALRRAVNSGSDAYREVRSIVESQKTPESIRVAALRVLLERFPGRSSNRLLSRIMLESGRAHLRAWCLKVAVRRPGFPIEPVLRMAQDPEVAEPVRVRATRYLGNRVDKRLVREHLEGLLSSDCGAVAQAALHGLFSTLRYIPASQVEAALCNLLSVHQDPAVCASAARALGVFGRSERSLLALRNAASSWGHPTVRSAARAALLGREG